MVKRIIFLSTIACFFLLTSCNNEEKTPDYIGDWYSTGKYFTNEMITRSLRLGESTFTHEILKDADVLFSVSGTFSVKDDIITFNTNKINKDFNSYNPIYDFATIQGLSDLKYLFSVQNNILTLKSDLDNDGQYGSEDKDVFSNLSSNTNNNSSLDGLIINSWEELYSGSNYSSNANIDYNGDGVIDENDTNAVGYFEYEYIFSRK